MRRTLFIVSVGIVASGIALATCADSSDEGERLTANRQHLLEVENDGQTRLSADLEIPFGAVSVGESEAGTVFQVEASLPFDDVEPRLERKTERNGQSSIAMRLSGSSATLEDLRRTAGTTWRLFFSHETPLDLSVQLGAAESDLNLTGVPLTALHLETGVARTALRFDEANEETATEIRIEAGVSSFEATGLGNARFERLRFTGGVGSFDLDFSGDAMVAGAEVDLDLGVGKLTVSLPRDGLFVVEIPTSRATSIDVPDGMTKSGTNRYATEDALDNPDAATIRIDAGPGSVRLRWSTE